MSGSERPVYRLRSSCRLAAFFCLVWLCWSGPAMAQAPEIYFVDGAASGANNGSSWADAYTDLQQALQLAEAGDEIWVAAGTYWPTATSNRSIAFQLNSGVALYGGFAGTESVRDQRDWVAQPTILSGDIGLPGDATDNSRHVVTASDTITTTVLDGVTVTGGYYEGGFGGGLYLDGGALLVSNVTFAANHASSGGGMMSSNSAPRLVNVAFYDNTAVSGGGLENYGSQPDLVSVTFGGNSAEFGGGMTNFFSPARLMNVAFTGNSATSSGGGLANWCSYPAIVNSTFSGNSARNDGGGIHNDCYPPPSGGRGIAAPQADKEIEIVNTILWANEASSGSQMYSEYLTPTIHSSLIQGCQGSGQDWDSQLGTDLGGNLDSDPLFLDALGADGVCGTQDDDLRLHIVSPAADRGDNAALPDDTADLDGDGDRQETVPYDLYGRGRVNNRTVDLGACEAQKHVLYVPLIAR